MSPLNATLLFTSLGIGLAIAAPVGPMSLLCMQTALARGPWLGLIVGLGIASADAIYGLVAALGLGGVAAFILAYDRALRVVAAAFLFYLGIRAMRQAVDVAVPREGGEHRGALRTYVTSALLTLANPQTIISFAALFATLVPKGEVSPDFALTTVAGIFGGSLIWWCLIVASVSRARHAFSVTARRWINRLAGLSLALFALAQLRIAF